MKKLILLIIVLLPLVVQAQNTTTVTRTIIITAPNVPPDIISVKIPDPVIVNQLARFRVKIVDANNFSIWLIYKYRLIKDSVLVSVLPGQPLEIEVGLTFTRLGTQSATFSVRDNQILGSTVTVMVNVTVATGVEDESVPTRYSLSQNYPNPFNPATTIRFGLPNSEYVNLIVYDLLGREVATLINESKLAGYHTVEFNPGNLPSGIYLYKLTAGKFTKTEKMMLMK
ncbi:MAG: T9SS type A sorting domain-containing protein [Patescibacteria group bacterium]